MWPLSYTTSYGQRLNDLLAAKPWARNIVDELIAERAPHLVSNPLGQRLLRDLLFPLLDYDVAVELAERVRSMGGHEIFSHLCEVLEVRLVLSGIENVPATGRMIVVSNHPTGLADGMAVYGALKRVRPDIWFLANADALRLAPRLDEIIVPVEWVAGRRNHASSRLTLSATGKLLRNEECLVIFPSGRLSFFSWHGLQERRWQPTVVALARKFNAPIVPMRIVARNSWLFYMFSQVSRELRDITLFHELLNKRRRLFELHIGPPIDAGEISGETVEAARRLQRFVTRGMRNRELLKPRWRRPGHTALAVSR